MDCSETTNSQCIDVVARKQTDAIITNKVNSVCGNRAANAMIDESIKNWWTLLAAFIISYVSMRAS